MIFGAIIDLENIPIPINLATNKPYRYIRTIQYVPGGPVQLLYSENTRYWSGGIQMDEEYFGKKP